MTTPIYAEDADVRVSSWAQPHHFAAKREAWQQLGIDAIANLPTASGPYPAGHKRRPHHGVVPGVPQTTFRFANGQASTRSNAPMAALFPGSLEIPSSATVTDTPITMMAKIPAAMPGAFPKSQVDQMGSSRTVAVPEVNTAPQVVAAVSVVKTAKQKKEVVVAATNAPPPTLIAAPPTTSAPAAITASPPPAVVVSGPAAVPTAPAVIVIPDAATPTPAATTPAPEPDPAEAPPAPTPAESSSAEAAAPEAADPEVPSAGSQEAPQEDVPENLPAEAEQPPPTDQHATSYREPKEDRWAADLGKCYPNGFLVRPHEYTKAELKQRERKQRRSRSGTESSSGGHSSGSGSRRSKESGGSKRRRGRGGFMDDFLDGLAHLCMSK